MDTNTLILIAVLAVLAVVVVALIVQRTRSNALKRHFGRR